MCFICTSHLLKFIEILIITGFQNNGSSLNRGILWGWTSSRNQSMMINITNLVYLEVTLIRLVARCSDVDIHIRCLSFLLLAWPFPYKSQARIRSMELCVFCWLYSVNCKFEASYSQQYIQIEAGALSKFHSALSFRYSGTCSFSIPIRTKSEAITLRKAQVWYKCSDLLSSSTT